MRKANLVLILLLLVFGFGSCAKNIGPDKVGQLATVIGNGFSDLAYNGLKIVKQYKPSQVQPTIDDINAAVSVAQQYVDNKVDIQKVSQSFQTLFDRLNARFELVGNPLFVASAKTLVATAANFASVFINGTTIPDEAGLYVGAAASGLLAGVNRFESEQAPAPEPTPTPEVSWLVDTTIGLSVDGGF